MPWIVICAVLLACSPAHKTSETKEAESVQVVAPSEKAIESPSKQSFEAGMQLLCDSVDKVDSNLAPSERQRAVAQWIDENVKNSQVRELFSIMGDVPPNKRAGMMKAAAAKAGITLCAIAER
ncbi:MAG: hypothetical protein GY811_05390 [Myxococcales bacterium]|nr:hypothetical protein [Myxococcales bacterium]